MLTPLGVFCLYLCGVNYMRLNAEQAKELLFQDVISTPEDLTRNENRWVNHCINVGEAAGRIAAQMGLDSDFAKAEGYLHDIGRKVSHQDHVMAGYHYLVDLGYGDMARSCLTHSFIDNDINLVAGGVLPFSEQQRLFSCFDSRLTDGNTLCPANDYDNIIQLCDLFCLDTGFTTLENRLLDVYSRKGIFSNTRDHFQGVFQLKQKIEDKMGCSLYSLFPEISEEEKERANEDHHKIGELMGRSAIKKR